jgi:hypothetical protein
LRDPRIQLEPPLSQVAWSDEFAARSLEALFVFLRDGGPIMLRPIHADSLLLGWGAREQPGAVVVEAAARYDLNPVVVHSTSWRTVEDRLILTYLAVVDAPERPGQHLTEVPVLRGDLARGERLAAPTHIDVDAVIEHALRHLRWLVDDDEIVRDALPDWPAVLEDYRPEPFRAFVTGPEGRASE